MKKICGLALSSIFVFSSLHANAAMTRTNFSCQIQGEATEQGINSVIRYSKLDLSFLKDSSGRTEQMNVILRGQRTSRISVRIGGPVGNPEDGMSLMISEKDLRGDLAKDQSEAQPKNKESKKPGFGLFGGGSTENAPVGNEKLVQREASAALPTGSITKISLDGSAITAPVVPAKDEYELHTTVSDSIETLTYDYVSEILSQQYEQAEAQAENSDRELRNAFLKAEYDEKMLQYQEDLRDETLKSHTTGTPMRAVYKPYEPRYESLLQIPNGPINISYGYKGFPAARGQPKSTLNVVINSSSIADLECIQTNNLVDHKSEIEADVKGKYNNGASGKPVQQKKATDPRAVGFGGTFALPTINRMERELWCLKPTLVGTINLAHFNKGTFKVNCEYSGNQPSDN